MENFTCDGCKNQIKYTTGSDEYPAHTTMLCCSKGHWENSPEAEVYDADPWIECKDLDPITTLPIDSKI